MVNLCCVPGCPTRSDASLPKNLHRFPLHSQLLRRKWMTAVGLHEEPQPHQRVCSHHFGTNDVDTSTKKRLLKANAVPTMLLPSTLSAAPSLVNTQRASRNGQSTADRLASCRKRNEVLRIKNQQYQMKFSKMKCELRRLKNQLSVLKLRKKNEIRGLRLKISAQNTKYDTLEDTTDKMLRSIFTEKQVKVLKNSQLQAKWTNEDIGKAITLRYKHNAYEHLRAIGFPFPSTRTLQRWTQQIKMEPGILYCVLNLLKNEFQHAEELSRQCLIGFDEVSIDSSIVYDPEEDKIYGPKNNLNAWLVRGLFTPWKQLVAYQFDEKLSKESFMEIVTEIEKCGLRVRGNVNDLGGKNVGLWRKLGIKCEFSQSNEESTAKIKSFCENPVSGEKLWMFADAPHLLKLIRNNLVNHGFTLKGGYKLRKSDLERLCELDQAELRVNFPLTKDHLNLKGKQKQTVAFAVHLFSKRTAEAWKIAFPNRAKEGDFLQLVSDWFDLFNSRFTSETLPSKKPFGLNLEHQMEVLTKMKSEILQLRVGESNGLYPFQRGILISIESLLGIYDDMSGSSLRTPYILTSRLNLMLT